MSARLRVTIDTNAINARGRNPHLRQLETWHGLGLIEIIRTRILTEEIQPYADGLRKAHSYSERTSGFVMRRSTVRGGDVVGGPNAYRWLPAVTQILFPDKSFEELHVRSQRDVMHLCIHKANRLDYFVTMDNDILGHAAALRNEVGITALSPEDAAREIGDRLESSPS